MTENQKIGLTSDDIKTNDWIHEKLSRSRIQACGRLQNIQALLLSLKVKLIIAPLFLQDLCVLALAEKLQVPVVGVLTSRVSSWWTFNHLGLSSGLYSAPVLNTDMPDQGLLSRIYNIKNYYKYITEFKSWNFKAAESLPEFLKPSQTITELHKNRIVRLVYSWDALVDNSIASIPFAIPIGSFYPDFGADGRTVINAEFILG